MKLQDLAGYDLGRQVVNYTDRDAILYALAIGARHDQLDLVYERDLRVLPTYACALGLWAVEKAGGSGAYDRNRSLHAGQKLEIRKPLSKAGKIEMHGTVLAVWDKGKASMVEIAVECEEFIATYSIFLPGLGGWGGERGPSSPSRDVVKADWQASFRTDPNLAAFYRLTGDRHPIHIDPEVAKANGFDRPILHGLCTLGIAAREIAGAAGAHPCDLKRLDARLAAPVLPGATINFIANKSDNGFIFEARVDDTTVLKNGEANF
jgi:acyl dehydratase